MTDITFDAAIEIALWCLAGLVGFAFILGYIDNWRRDRKGKRMRW